MTTIPRSLPAYLRLPDGLRFTGAIRLDQGDQLRFDARQALNPRPPEGLPLTVIVAGLPDQEETQFLIEAEVVSCGNRDVIFRAEGSIPTDVARCLDPEGNVWPQEANRNDALISALRERGLREVGSSMRRFLIDLGDHLFDLSTSSRYGISGQHSHYDALNNLKRQNKLILTQFGESVAKSLEDLAKEASDRTSTSLEATSARSLQLVALADIDQQLAIDRVIGDFVDRFRVPLECLTIRAATLAGLDPLHARTPFHPAYIVNAFAAGIDGISDNTVVREDSLRFFRQRFSHELQSLYSGLNSWLVEAGINPDLEDQIAEHGSLLNPPNRRAASTEQPGREHSAATSDSSADLHPSESSDTTSAESQPLRSERAVDPAQSGSRTHATGKPPAAPQNHLTEKPAQPRVGGHAYDDAHGKPANSDQSTAGRTTRDRHDAMYEAVLAALDATADLTNSGTAPSAARKPAAESSASIPNETPSNEETLSEEKTLSEAETLEVLQQLQNAGKPETSLSSMTSLLSLLREATPGERQIDRSSANRLSFVDTVFQTLHNNFDVSEDMAPNLARLRLPLARLSLQEPRFFTEPDHPAHQLLNKLSRLAGADQGNNRALQKKVNAVVDRIVSDYEQDSQVFEDAQHQLDHLLRQQDQVLERNVERLVGTLEGQERLASAQRLVDERLRETLDPEAAPEATLALLNAGWRDALVQIYLRDGAESPAWNEEIDLLRSLSKDLYRAAGGTLPSREQREMQLRLRALGSRLSEATPGSLAHESALSGLLKLLSGGTPIATRPYPSQPQRDRPAPDKVASLPRLRRWLQRVAELQTGSRLRYRGRDGRLRHMQLVWRSQDGNRFAFVNERGQKIAELTAIQLARQLSRGATPSSQADRMSVLEQSIYDTLEGAQRALSFSRNRDSLTQLINGNSLFKQLGRSVNHAQTRGAEHAFILLDIDRFKLVNEVFDELAGDQVLVEFAKLLAQLNDRRALTARLDEDTFGILLTFRSIDEARHIADRIRADIADSSLTVSGEEVTFTVSMGVAPILESTDSSERVLQNARTALALAKAQGRDQVVAYHVDQEEILQYQQDRDTSRARLEEALTTDQLVLRGQPIVTSSMDGSESTTRHYEVLLALRGEDGELHSPQDFIASAERFGFITQVDQWVIRETFTWISSLIDRQKSVPELSINLSGASLTDYDFLNYMLEQISEFGVGTNRLCFEITETGTVDNLPVAADFVRTLRNLGCKFSLDDFGTGLSSYSYLKELPVDYVKIDGSFVTEIHQNHTDYAMAKSINDLAHFLGQKTIAECVETLDSLPALREIGVDYLQGWGVGMPRPLSEVSEELADLET